MKRQIAEADFIIFVCATTYRRRFEGKERLWAGPHGASGVEILRASLYDEGGDIGPKLIPILFEGEGSESIPYLLRPYTSYRVPSDYDALYRRITSQPKLISPQLGSLRSLPPAAAQGQEAMTLPLSSSDESLSRTRSGTRPRTSVVLAAEANRRDDLVATIEPEFDGTPYTLCPVDLESVDTLLATIQPPSLLVVFATSDSHEHARVVAERVPYAIGFEASVRDETIALFCFTFFRNLGSRPAPDIPRAFILARLACIAEGHSDAEYARIFSGSIVVPTRHGQH